MDLIAMRHRARVFVAAGDGIVAARRAADLIVKRHNPRAFVEAVRFFGADGNAVDAAVRRLGIDGRDQEEREWILGLRTLWVYADPFCMHDDGLVATVSRDVDRLTRLAPALHVWRPCHEFSSHVQTLLQLGVRVVEERLSPPSGVVFWNHTTDDFVLFEPQWSLSELLASFSRVFTVDPAPDGTELDIFRCSRPTRSGLCIVSGLFPGTNLILDLWKGGFSLRTSSHDDVLFGLWRHPRLGAKRRRSFCECLNLFTRKPHSE